MSLSSLLEFTAVTQPPYFSPGVDLELYDEESERWKPLRTTHYSLETLVESLHQDSLDPASVRIAEEDARAYLEHLRYTGIDEQLHHDPRMDRSRLIAFADAGYTDVADLLQSADPIDISRETGIDRTIITEIATDHVGGFDSGNSFRTTGPLADVKPAPRDDFKSW